METPQEPTCLPLTLEMDGTEPGSAAGFHESMLLMGVSGARCPWCLQLQPEAFSIGHLKVCSGHVWAARGSRRCLLCQLVETQRCSASLCADVLGNGHRHAQGEASSQGDVAKETQPEFPFFLFFLSFFFFFW